MKKHIELATRKANETGESQCVIRNSLTGQVRVAVLGSPVESHYDVTKALVHPEKVAR